MGTTALRGQTSLEGTAEQPSCSLGVGSSGTMVRRHDMQADRGLTLMNDTQGLESGSGCSGTSFASSESLEKAFIPPKPDLPFHEESLRLPPRMEVGRVRRCGERLPKACPATVRNYSIGLMMRNPSEGPWLGNAKPC